MKGIDLTPTTITSRAGYCQLRDGDQACPDRAEIEMALAMGRLDRNGKPSAGIRTVRGCVRHFVIVARHKDYRIVSTRPYVHNFGKD